MNDSWHLRGPNVRVRIEGDIVVVQSFGVTTLDDMKLIFEAYAMVRRAHPTLFALYDSRYSKGVTSEARKAIVNANSHAETTDAAAVFGAPFAMRALVNMLDRASMFLRGRPLGVAMFATESEARNYLEQQRFRLSSNHMHL